MSVRYFCMLFDRNYLFKGVATIRSLIQHCPSARIFVLCMDEITHSIIVRLEIHGVTCIALSDIEDDELKAAKVTRGVAEYCWTLSPCLPSYVIQQYPEVDLITYIDSDLLFFSSVSPLFAEIGSNSIAIIEHRFSPRLKDREVNGRFCVEWVTFRRDEEGIACLTRWREQCIEWCYYRAEEGRMGDQKYLDEWPGKYHRCHIIASPGAGIAPWNYSQYRFTISAEHQCLVNGSPLIFYHFHQFQLLESGRFDRLSEFYTAECEEPDAIYRAYEVALLSSIGEVLKVEPGFTSGFRPDANVSVRRLAQRYLPRIVKDVLKRFVRY